MKLWEVRNGYTGESYVRVLVLAETPHGALNAARAAYKKRYDEGRQSKTDYFEDLTQPQILCEDVSKPWASEPRS